MKKKLLLFLFYRLSPMQHKSFFLFKRSIIYYSFLPLCGFLLSSCAVTGYFKTPNDTNKAEATIYFLDNTVRKGLLTVVFENDDPNMNHIDFVSDSSDVRETLDIKKIKSYSIAGNVYVPKLVDIYVNRNQRYLFVKRLTTENAKLQLFELHQLFKSSDSGVENFEYFISSLGSDVYEAININSSQLLPFDKKMSTYISGCPQLLQKIQQHQKNYYYSSATFKTKRIEVIKRIVSEYNNCN
jgi:hypothetical protein